MSVILNKLKLALSKTSNRISSGIEEIFYKKKIDEDTLNNLEELLISADIGYSVTQFLIQQIKMTKLTGEFTTETIKNHLISIIYNILEKNNVPFKLTHGLNVVLVYGVNGCGKTTTIGKLAFLHKNQNKNVAIAACDTFRAAAIDQLKIWADKSMSMFIKSKESSDPASVAYSAIKESIKNNIDILLIDTAGRLHNHKNLMEELNKIITTIKKIDNTAPQHRILVLDATTGQNVYNQIEHFNSNTKITSLVVTKLDGTSKAGVIIGATQRFAIPVSYIGIGEQIDDLRTFDPQLFATNLIK